MKLYGYWRSSASYRVRIALNLKGLDVEHISINLKGGAQHGGDYLAINSEALVPTLELDTGLRLTQSLAILEYLDETFEGHKLLPQDAKARADVRAVAAMVASDTAPIQNLRVLKYLRQNLSQAEDAVTDWIVHWIGTGLANVNAAATTDAAFLLGDQPGLAECCLIPQLYNARRFAVDLSPFEKLLAVEASCMALPAFDRARPENQHDAD